MVVGRDLERGDLGTGGVGGHQGLRKEGEGVNTSQRGGA